MNKKIILASLLVSPLLIVGCQSASDFFFDDRDYRGDNIYHNQRHGQQADVKKNIDAGSSRAVTTHKKAVSTPSVPSQAPRANSSVTRIPNAAPEANATTPAAVIKAPKSAGPVMVPAAPMASPNAAATVPSPSVGQ